MKQSSIFITAAIGLLLFVTSCSDRETGSGAELPASADTSSEMPAQPEARLASIGGAQDVWPFTFGFDADRAAVQQALGPPESIQDEGNVITWSYPSLELDFFQDQTDETEYLLAAHISEEPGVPGEATALNGGLRLGMSLDEALQLLGEPGHESGRYIVYFYYSTTIELLIRDNSVDEVVLARAMP